MAAKIPLKTSTLHHRNPKLLIPILISSIKAPENPSSKSLLKSCSTKLLHFLQTSSSSSSATFLETHLKAILALIPIMLFRPEIVSTVAKIVGFLSLLSIEVNEMISDDKEILKGLVVKIVGCDDWVLKTRLVNVVLDVCVTLLGRQRLIEISGLDYLMLAFLQVKKTMPSSNSIIIMEKEGDLCLGTELSQGKLPLLLFGAAVTLTNFCEIEQLKIISRKLIEALVPYWKEIWSNLHKQLLASKVMNHSKHKCSYLSNVTVYNLAESIFKLSAYCSGLARDRALQSDVIDHLFRPETSIFKNFLLEHWESSPFLKRKRLEDMKSAHDIFGIFMHSLTSEESMPEFIVSLLQGMVSCPPVTLDDINGLDCLNDVRDTLGCPLIYQQDIRVVKTNLRSRIENHYFQESSSKGMEVSRPFSFNEILKCVVAYREGYTVAIRGMEYRTESIALITQLVANLFGQPSVGANLYVTPPNSQGLACHYDDHCFFICQLRGSKKWNVSPKPVVQLPRLYENLQVPQEILMDGRKILLEEGDVLYIPRGFAHEAHTVSDSSESIESSDCSVHLTLAIDVEPSFEWEGFAHVALHGWIYGRQDNDCASNIDGTLQTIYVNVLHVAIKLISHSEPVFRKACLVAANSFPQETNNWLDENQRFIFNRVINKVHESANFTDSIKFVKLVLQRNEDPFQMFGWLKHLNGKMFMIAIALILI